MAGNTNNRKAPPSLEVAQTLYGSAFNASSREEVGSAMDDWSELSEEERSFALGHLLYLNLQVQAENSRLLRRAVGELEEINDAVQELTDDYFEEEDDGGEENSTEEEGDEEEEQEQELEEELNEEPAKAEGEAVVDSNTAVERFPGGEIAGEAVGVLEPASGLAVEQSPSRASADRGGAGTRDSEAERPIPRQRSRTSSSRRTPRAGRGTRNAATSPEQAETSSQDPNHDDAGRNR